MTNPFSVFFICVLLFLANAVTHTVAADPSKQSIQNSIVKIMATHNHPDYRSPWQRKGINSVTGSGVIIGGKRVLTNAHVVADQTLVEVQREGYGSTYTAEVEFVCHSCDLAILQIEDETFFEDAVALEIDGLPQLQSRVAVYGFPTGGETISITEGIVSRIEVDYYVHSSERFLLAQVDAAINPGNSGGPLFNMNGEVIGIDTAIIAHGQNIGFAIPVNIAKDLLPQLKSGKIVRGWLGVMIQDITPELAKSFGLKETKGVLISDVTKDSPAEKAGLKRGDIVTRFNGKEAENAHTLSRLVAATPPNTETVLGVIRDGKEQSINLTIGIMPQKEESQLPEKPAEWGMTVEDITPELAQQLGLNPGEKGVVVSSVEPGSPAAEAGLQPGDVVKEVNRQPIQNTNGYSMVLEKVKEGENVLLLIKRGSGTLYLVLKSSSDK